MSTPPITKASSALMGGEECAGRKKLLEATNDESTAFFNTYDARRLSTTHKLPPALKQPSKDSPYINYEDLNGYKMPGLEVTSHKRESSKKLNFERGMRATASGLGSVLSLGATLGLFYSGAKTLSAVSNGGDQDDANQASANSFGIAAIAGVGNALAQENANWGIGAAGMGFLGKYLDTPLGLSLFSIFDGLNAIGMGQVKLRDQKNITPFDNSIFDKPWLKKFDFLKQYEYAVKNFFQKFLSPRGWKQIKTSEPYDLYYAAGGGLLSGGAALGVASLFSKWMSERVKSLLYLPYSLTSMINITALGRDGAVTKERVRTYNDVKPLEKNATITEGWAKLIASPVIALNYAMLGLKGLGIDIAGSSENIAKSLRQIGVGIAYIGFAAQSGSKLFTPDQWGPKAKHIIEVILNPKKVMDYLMNLVNETKKKETDKGKIDYSAVSDYFYPRLIKDEFAPVFEEVMKTKDFSDLDDRHLTGLTTEMAPDRGPLKRGPHSIRVGGIGCNTIDSTINNNPKHSYLFDDAVRLGIKLAPLVHDIGHAKLPRCHLAETAFPMAKDANDHLSIEALRPGSETYNATIKGCIKKYGNKEKGESIAKKAIQYAIAILGHNSIEVEAVNPETGKSEKKIIDYRYKQLTDMADYMRSKGSDYPVSFNLPAWGKDEYNQYANQVKIFEKDGKIKFGFTEEGAITTFKHLYYRILFNAFLNSHPVTLAIESAYKVGARQTNATLDEVYKMSDYELDNRAAKAVQKIDTKSKQVIRNVFGGTKAYAGYGPKDTIYVVREHNGKEEQYEFLDYYHNVLKNENPEAYNSMSHMVEVVTNPTMLEVILNIDPTYGEEKLQSTVEEPTIKTREISLELQKQRKAS